MLTKEVNDWIKKVETKNHSTWDIMEEFANFSKYLTKAEMVQIKKRLNANKRDDFKFIQL